MANEADLIKKARKERGWSQGRLAQESGASQSTIDRIEKGGDSTYLYAVMNVLGLSGAPSKAVATPSRLPIVPDVYHADERGLPIFASAAGGAGQMVVTREPIDWIAAPGPLSKVKDAFGVYIVGDSMSPAYEQGNLALVNPHKPPRPGDDVLIYREVDGEMHCMIKRLQGSNGRYWKLLQHNPPPGEKKEFTLERAEWPKILLVTGRLMHT